MLVSSTTRCAELENRWKWNNGHILIIVQAVGVVPAEGDKGGVTLITKKVKHPQRPAQHSHKVTLGGNKSTRK